MSTLSYSIASIGRNDTNHISAAFFSPFGNGVGGVFVVYTLSRNATSSAIIETVKERIERWSARAAPDPGLLETSFEHIIQTVNEACVTRLPEGPATDDSIIIGAVSGTSIAIAAVGDCRGTLIRKSADNTFHVFDLLRGFDATATSETLWFGSLVSGELQIGDHMGITPTAVTGVLGEATWKKTLATLAPGPARTHFERALADTSESFHILLVKMVPAVSLASAMPLPVESIEALRNTQRATEQFLGSTSFGMSSLLTQIRQMIKTNVQKMYHFISTLPRKLRSAKIHESRSTNALNTAHHNPVTNTMRRVSKIVHTFVTVLSNDDSRRAIPKHIGTYLSVKNDRVVYRWNALSRHTKFIALSALLIMILFIQSILYVGMTARARAIDATKTATIAALQQDIDTAQAMLIYQDEMAARTLLDQTLTHISKLPNRSNTDRSTITDLRRNVETMLSKLRHEIIVAPTIVATLPTSVPLLNFDALLSRYPTIETANTNTPLLINGTHVLEHTSTNTLVWTPTDTSAPTLPVFNAETAITDATPYNNRAYFLSAKKGVVYRANVTTKGFGAISTSVSVTDDSLADSRAIAVDGAVYVLHPTGITKFFNGQPQTWSGSAEPSLKDATHLIANDTTTDIYILEPSAHRVIVFSKTGGFIAQYLFPQNSNLRDLVVDEKSKTLAVLDGNNIEHVALTHSITK